MRNICFIASVNYSDMLEKCLPFNKRVLKGWTILLVTQEKEVQSLRRLCEDALGDWLKKAPNELIIYSTDLFWENGSAFNKGLALNRAIQSEVLGKPTSNRISKAISLKAEENAPLHSPPSRPSWLLSLDSDIVFPESFPVLTPSYLSSLNPRNLYCTRRKVCGQIEVFDKFKGKWNRFPEYRDFDNPNGGIWEFPGITTTRGMRGFFQMWNNQYEPRQLPEIFPTAAKYDAWFGATFSDDHRVYLQEKHEPAWVLHLGPVQCNWKGRVTPEWKED